MTRVKCKKRDLDQMQHSMASDLGLHCLQMPILGMPGRNGYLVTGDLGQSREYVDRECPDQSAL